MKNFKQLILLNFILMLLVSCGTLKEGFKNQKKENSDEFLVEKKSPLVMPPNYGELPEPSGSSNIDNNEKNKAKDLISKSKKNITNTKGSNDISKSIENSVLDKIKNN